MDIFKKANNKLIQFSIILFWSAFWFFNVVDKFIFEKTFLWVGKDRLLQFSGYFSSIGLENKNLILGIFIFITLIEILALVFALVSLISFLKKKYSIAMRAFFNSILVSLFIFLIFSIGDQAFGDRFELLEHTLFWISLLISWFIYSYLDTKTE